MESRGLPGRIHVTERVAHLVRDQYDFEARGPIDVKGMGPMCTYLLVAPRTASVTTLSAEPIGPVENPPVSAPGP